MRILELGWEFPPQKSGGLGTACEGICRGLLRLGHDVTFFMPSAPERDDIALVGANSIHQDNPTDGSLTPYSIASSLLPYHSETSYQDTPHPFEGGYGASLFEEVQRFASVAAQFARKGAFDVIHAHDWMTFPAASAIRHLAQVPIAAHVHSLEIDRAPQGANQTIMDMEKQGLQAADAIICVSGRTKSMVIDQYGIESKKIHVAHNAAFPVTRPRKKHPWGSDKLVVYLGRITHQKGPETFVLAAAQLLQYMQDVQFIMAGDGDLLRPMIERVTDARLQRHFHFTGFLKDNHASDLLAMADLYVLPSVSEPFGIAPLEAMLHGVPVIVTNQAGVVGTEVDAHAPENTSAAGLSRKQATLSGCA